MLMVTTLLFYVFLRGLELRFNAFLRRDVTMIIAPTIVIIGERGNVVIMAQSDIDVTLPFGIFFQVVWWVFF